MNEPRTLPAGPATAPDSCSAAISSPPKPAAASTSSVCSPSAGTGRPVGIGRRAAELDRRPEQPDRLARRRAARARPPSPAPPPALTRAPRRESSTGSRQQSCSEANVAPLLAGAAGEDLAHRAMRVRARRVEGVVEQVLAPDALAPGPPELRLERAQRHVAVGAAVRPVARERAGQLELAAPRRAPGRERLGRHQREPRQGAVEHRAVDELALARALALAQRDQDPDRAPSAHRRRCRRSGRPPVPAARRPRRSGRGSR